MSIFDSYNFDWESTDNSPIGNAIGNYMSGNSGTDYGAIGNAINDYVQAGNTSSGFGSALSNADWSKILGTLGKVGSGIGGFIAAREAGKRPDYIPYTRWLGNGLAQTGYINNTSNKQNQLNKIFGTTNMLSSLFKNGYSLFGNNNFNDTSSLSGDIYNTESIYGNGTYGPVGNAIDNYMRL